MHRTCREFELIEAEGSWGSIPKNGVNNKRDVAGSPPLVLQLRFTRLRYWCPDKFPVLRQANEAFHNVHGDDVGVIASKPQRAYSHVRFRTESHLWLSLCEDGPVADVIGWRLPRYDDKALGWEDGGTG